MFGLFKKKNKRYTKKRTHNNVTQVWDNQLLMWVLITDTEFYVKPEDLEDVTHLSNSDDLDSVMAHHSPESFTNNESIDTNPESTDSHTDNSSDSIDSGFSDSSSSSFGGGGGFGGFGGGDSSGGSF